MPELLEFKVKTFSPGELIIQVKNTSGASLDKTLAIEIYPPMYLVSAAVNEAAVKAASNEEPPGAMRLDGIVTGPAGWSIWARRESSDSTLVIVLMNDRNQQTGAELSAPVAFPAGAESIIRIPLNPEALQDNVDLLYSYTHGDPEARIDGKLELKSTEVTETPPDVTLTTDHKTPTMIKAGDLAKVIWHVKDGVSAILRGPLPGDNSELELSPSSVADFKMADGALSVRVVGLMNYLLQAEVKRPGKPNLQVVKMLTLDTANKHHLYLGPRHRKVLRHGLIELDWAAWGVPRVEITAGDTTRVIKLTQQTFGGSYEGSGVMRFTASKPDTETILIEAKPESKSETVVVVSWQHMTKPDIAGHPWGLAVIAPKIALLTFEGLYIANVGKVDPSPRLEKLMFDKKTAATPTEWIALTALGNRFLCLRRNDPNPDVEVAPFTINGAPDAIPPVSLHADLRQLAPHPKAVFDFVGFGPRAYVVVEAPLRNGVGRRAYSVGFNESTKRADYRPEPLLESLIGYRLVTFDDALYALNRESGQMFRIELTKAGTLGPPLQAASAVRKEDGQSMIKDGLIVPVGRVLVVLNPTSVPSLDSLEEYDLHNVLGYLNTSEDDANNLPQDLVYNPQKNYWARSGRALTVKPGAVAAFREDDSPRLWVVQPDGETHTLPVGSESLFVRDYALNFPTKPLSPYFNKKRKFTIKHQFAFGPIEEKYRRLGLTEVSTSGPREVSPLPARAVPQLDVEISYNEANPAPVTLRFQLARRPQSRMDVDHLLEVTFSGPDLSTATSCFRRLSIVSLRLTNDEVFGSTTQHSTDSIIEVPRPARFDEHLRFVIVNASAQFRIKPKPPLNGINYILEEAFIPIHQEVSDFALEFDGRIATQGVIGVNFNFALPHGIEASSGNQPQTKLIRLNTDQAQKIEVKLVKVLMPGDAPLQLQGAKQPIEPMPDRPVFVCQLDYKM